MTTNSLPDFEALLRDAGWMRPLASALVGDGASADDLVQDAWVAALQGPGREVRVPRSWLGGVLRHLSLQRHRSVVRRVRRERAAARAESTSPDSVADEVALQRDVADALLAVSEPERTALHLRFFRGMSLAAISKQLGVPVSTVHDRIERGLRHMRGRLDAGYGRRSAWVAVLLPLTKPVPAGVPLGLSAIAVNTVVRVCVVAASLVGVTLWVTSGPDEVALPSTPTASAEPAAPMQVEAAEPASREVVLGEAPVEVPAESAPVATQRTLQGSVVDVAQSPVAGVRVVSDGGESELRTSASGRFEVAVGDEAGIWEVEDPYYTTILRGIERFGEIRIVVAPRLDFRGQVVDQGGQPLAGVRVAVEIEHELFAELGVARELSRYPDGWSTRTDDLGRFALEGVTGGSHLFFQVEQSGFHPLYRDVPAQADADLQFVLTPLPRGERVWGVVLDSEGVPLGGARVSAGDRIVRSRSDGSFDLSIDSEEDRVSVVAVAKGQMPARVEFARHESACPLTLRLGGAPREIRGRVVDENGEPWPGAVVWALEPTPFGKERSSLGRNSAVFSVMLEEAMLGRRRMQGASTRADADGGFVLGGLLDRAYSLVATDPTSMVERRGIEVMAGNHAAVIELSRTGLARVAGRVTSVSGEPLAGVDIGLETIGSLRGQVSLPWPYRQKIATDADGAFSLERIHLDSVVLRVGNYGETGQVHVRLANEADPGDVTVSLARVCELQVFTESPGADRLEVLDAAGTALRLSESFGVFDAFGEDAEVREGKSGVLRVSERAATVVLYQGENEVGRQPITLDPGAPLEVRF